MSRAQGFGPSRIARCATFSVQYPGELEELRDGLAGAGFCTLASTWKDGQPDQVPLFAEVLHQQLPGNTLLMGSLDEHFDIAQEVVVLCAQRMLEQDAEDVDSVRSIVEASSVLLYPRAFHFVGIGGLRPDLVRDMPSRVDQFAVLDVLFDPASGWVIRDVQSDQTAAVPE